MSSHLKTVLATARPNFLLLSVVVVALASSAAHYHGAPWSWSLFGLLLLSALLAHAAVNMLNEYEDFKSGLDHLTQRTPFSGGSGALPANPAAAEWVKRTVWVLVAVLIALGGFLIWLKGWLLMPLGLAGLLLIFFYTSLITRLPWLCLVAPGLAFGPIMVLGIYYVWTETLTWSVLVVSLVPFFLVNNLLLLNQYPDLEADRQAGRYNILMHLGPQQGHTIFFVFLGFGFLSLSLAVGMQALPAMSLIALLSLFIVFPMVKKVIESRQNTDKLMPALAMNVIINHLTPLLLSAGVFWPVL